MTLQIADHTELTDTGRQRRSNEDSVYAAPPVFVVADGMGGAQAGEVASGIAIEAFRGGLPEDGSSEERLAAVAHAANARIHDLAIADRQRAGMGSTLIAAHLDGSGVAIAHVGDSRAYRWRDGKLERLTRDHSLVGMWIERGDLTEEEAEEHPQRSVITRALGPEPSVEVETQTSPARDGDVFLLCSDGLTTMVSDPDLAALLAQGGTLEEIGHRLVDVSNERGGRDNITVVLFRVQEGAGGAEGELDPDTGAMDATQVGAAAPSVAEVQAALAARASGAAATEPPHPAEAQPAAEQPRKIAPKPPPSPPPKRSRRHARRVAFGIVAVLVIAAIVFGGFVATRDVYFVSTSPDGFIAVDRGLPYDLPFGIHLYDTVYRSGVAAAQLPPDRRHSVLDHQLRSRSDAYSLVRDIDAGKLTP